MYPSGHLCVDPGLEHDTSMDVRYLSGNLYVDPDLELGTFRGANTRVFPLLE